MNEEVRNEEVEEAVKEGMFKNLKISAMRAMLFICLLLVGMCVVIFIGFYDYDGDYLANGSKSKTKDDFFASEAFEDVLQQWSRQMCNYMMANSWIEDAPKLNSNEKLYSLTEYSEVVDSKLFKDNTIEESTLPAKDISFSELQKKNEYVANKISDGQDCGNEAFLFYNQLRDNLQSLTHSEDIKGFIHLNGRQFYALLDKYCTEDNLKQEVIQGQFADELEQFSYGESQAEVAGEDEYVDPDADENTTTEKEAEDATTYKDADPDTDDNTTITKSSYNEKGESTPKESIPKNTPKGFYNTFNGNFVIYSYYGGEDGSGHFLLNARGTGYDYAMRDVSISGDFYIPTALLDYSSQNDFEKSLITTPFTTVEEVMACLSMQSYMTEYQGEWDWAHGFRYSTLNEFDYAVTYLDADKKEQVLTNCRENSFRNGDILIYDKSKGTVTTNVKGMDVSEYKKLFESFKEFDEIRKVELRIDSGFGFNELGIMYLLSRASAHCEAIVLVGVLLAILAILLMAGIIYFLPAKVYQRDRHYLLSKTIVYGAGGSLFVYLAVVLLYFLCDRGMHFHPAVRVVAAGIAFVFLLGIAYFVLTEYAFSIVRLLKAKQFKEYLLIYHLWCRMRGGAKRFFQGIKQFFVEIWQATGYAKRAVVKRVLLLTGIMGCMFLLVVSMVAGVGAFIVFFFLALCAVLLIEVHDIYQFVVDQRMLDKIADGIKKLTDGDLSYKIDTASMKGGKKELAEMINHIGEGLEKAVAQSIKDERLKTELITNVSHDIKTPLTSIINYVDLMKREHVSEEPLKGYIEVLEQKSQRLKQLTEDLVEASKASTGSIELEPVNLNMLELVSQTIGEFEDKFEEKNLTLVSQIAEEDMVIFADGRRCYRIFENLFQNIYKYAMPNTRVYLSLKPEENKIVLCLKNISESPLMMDVSELTGRFVRGDASRTTEGSGLGLSIAQSLTTLQNGSFLVELDGDLFKVTITFERQNAL